MRYLQSFDFKQDGFDIKIYKLGDDLFEMDINHHHRQLTWSYIGFSSLNEAKELANKEIQMLLDHEEVLEYL